MQNNFKKILFLTALVFSAFLISSCEKQSIEIGETVKAETVRQTPADEKIAQAERMVEEFPDLAKSHNYLAMAYLQKVRETGDYGFNRQAETAIENALKIEPESFEARILQAQIFLSEHEFGKALEIAEGLEKIYQNNHIVLTVKTDAQTELGLYDEAVETGQKLVDLKPNAVSYTRVAYLRSLFGDTDGAIAARKEVLKMADQSDRENFAWFNSELGREFFNAGKYAEAEQMFDAALQIFPDYHWALEGKGKTLAAKGDYAKAIEYFEKIRVSETAREIYLADIYKKSGRGAEAEKLYAKIAEREMQKDGGDLHRIALLWADHDTNLDKALEIARKDREENRDLLSSDTLAWALYKKGEYAEAKKYIAEAMRLGTKNALFFYHKGMIENALGNKKEAAKFLKLALETNPAFDLLQAEKARAVLNDLS